MTPAELLASRRPPKKLGKRKPFVRSAPWSCSLRIARTELGLSLREVAQACDMTVAGLHQVEAGGNVLLVTAMKLAEFFGKPVTELWKIRKG